MKKLFTLCLFMALFVNAHAVVLVALNESSLTSRENAIISIYTAYGATPATVGANPQLSDLTAYDLVIATENGALSAALVNDLIDAGKKVFLLYNAGVPLGGGMEFQFNSVLQAG